MNNTELIEQILKQIKQPLWENWYIQEKIGSGAYSAVYRVTAERMKRTDVSALKIEPVVPAESTLADEERKRRSIEEKRELCMNESTIMYELRNCPYIVGYEDEDLRELIIDGKLEGYYFLIRMEYLNCLTDLIKAKKYTPTEKEVAKLAHDIGSGIKAAHDIGVIHRDVKPANFFLSPKGIYKLGDFNISKQTVSCDEFAGTNSYIAPEVRFAKSGSGDSYTCQADIYSFGICLYQLMNSFYMPFEETMSLKDAVNRRMSGEALPPPKNASPEFARVILKACAFSTAERYTNIDEMLADIASMYQPAAPQPQFYGQNGVDDPFLDPAVYGSAYAPAQKKNPVVIIAVIFTIIAIIGVGAVCYMLFGRKDNESGGGKAAASASKEIVPITEIDLSTDSIYIEMFEDLEIKSVNCPDTLSMSEELPADLFTYKGTVIPYARNDELTITVNDDATEPLHCDAPDGLEVQASLSGNTYNISIDAESLFKTEAKGAENTYLVVFFNSDESVAESVEVNVKLAGPLSSDGVTFTSSNSGVIEFTKDAYFLRGAGEATVNIVYDGEVKYSKKITVTE